MFDTSVKYNYGLFCGIDQLLNKFWKVQVRGYFLPLAEEFWMVGYISTLYVLFYKNELVFEFVFGLHFTEEIPKISWASFGVGVANAPIFTSVKVRVGVTVLQVSRWMSA